MTNHDWLRKYTQEDFAAATIRTSLGICGPVGVMIGEFLTQFVSGQRIDRLQDFIDQLGDRVAGMEEAFNNRLHESASYASLAEQASIAAAGSASSERHRHLAALLVHGLPRPDAELLEEHALLRLLEQLNDAEVLIMMGHGSFSTSFNDPERSAFMALHPTVFETLPPVLSDPPERRREWTMHEHYIDQLVGLNLLAVRGERKTPAIPRSVGITPLGSLLLEAIGAGPKRPTIE